MANQVLCKICRKRRARRACPAVGGDICTICCGTEREVSLSCPLECEYLREAHQHEKPLPIAPEQFSYPDAKVSEEFLLEHEELLLFVVYSLLKAAVQTGAIDADVMSALEALVQTQRTLESGLVYETRSENTDCAGSTACVFGVRGRLSEAEAASRKSVRFSRCRSSVSARLLAPSWTT